ncbi:F-box domain protein [Pandoravirus inopinatum]|uniref:F-box domain protein n=1 Tax=Pandoravirus inopinatum TaxID=1605721 RepID=A0A0B5IXE4_9VIRU|nr:F-box domain protein [Pandoravirus inopinatum]AJF97428.1 F-box domain protein [Pandoravirus inopinatum]
MDDLPDELLVIVVRAIETAERHASIMLRLVSCRWRSIVDDVHGPPVDPWVLGRCLEFLVQRGQSSTSPQARYDAFPAPWFVVEAAQKAGCGADMLYGPLAGVNMDAPTYADAVGDWPFDLYSCIVDVEAYRTPTDGDQVPDCRAYWTRLAAVERCLDCRSPTRSPRDFERYCDTCFLWRPRDSLPPPASGDYAWLFGRHQSVFLDEAEGTRDRNRWRWLARLARCYQTAVVFWWHKAPLRRQPCGHIIEEALQNTKEGTVHFYRMPTFRTLTLYDVWWPASTLMAAPNIGPATTFVLDDMVYRQSRWPTLPLPTAVASLDALD